MDFSESTPNFTRIPQQHLNLFIPHCQLGSSARIPTYTTPPIFASLHFIVYNIAVSSIECPNSRPDLSNYALAMECIIINNRRYMYNDEERAGE